MQQEDNNVEENITDLSIQNTELQNQTEVPQTKERPHKENSTGVIEMKSVDNSNKQQDTHKLSEKIQNLHNKEEKQQIEEKD